VHTGGPGSRGVPDVSPMCRERREMRDFSSVRLLSAVDGEIGAVPLGIPLRDEGMAQ